MGGEGESGRFENGDQAKWDRELSTEERWWEAGGRLEVGQAIRFWVFTLKSLGSQ